MRRTILWGVLLFLGFAVAFAPAGLLRVALDQIDGVTLTDPTGTIWHGRGQILLQGNSLGRLDWDIHPSGLLTGALSFDFELVDPGHTLTGLASLGISRTFALQVSGRMSADLVNRFLAPYDMMISGELSLTDAALTLSGGAAKSAGGSIAWSGGRVRYTLSGRTLTSELPPMVAYLGERAEATVFEQNGQTPLIRAELMENGFAKIGITKLLTKLLDNPWPGANPDHAVVLEVEEQIF
ncbi:MAG: type II secretion system protein N [Gammaproteobacteria bacterium]|nr:type II secretion system protein N [Gammaproteobacteria bacterium]